MVMTLPAIMAVDHIGRRPLMLIGTFIMIISFLYVGFYREFITTTTTRDLSGYTAIACIYIFMTGKHYVD